MRVPALRACGLSRREVSKWLIASSGCPAHSLSQPLVTQPRAKLGLKCQSTVDQFDGGINVLTKIGKSVSSPVKNARIITSETKRLSGEINPSWRFNAGSLVQPLTCRLRWQPAANARADP